MINHQLRCFPVSLLKAGDVTHFDVFLTNKALQIYALPGHTWTQPQIDMLITGKSAISHIYYLPRDAYEVDLFRAKKKIMDTTGDAAGDIANANSLIVRVLEKIRATGVFTDEARHHIEASTEVVIDQLVADPHNAIMMDQLKAHDDYTHQHNARVGVYSVGLAIKMGVQSREVLRSIALGGTLHDIGKMKVPLDILNKPGKLTPEEFNAIQVHPSIGAEMLQKHYASNRVVMDIVEKHHEKMDGSGYPHKLSPIEIPQYVRIATIADIFDALTTARSYHKPRMPYGAMAFMQEKMTGQIDEEAFKALVMLHADMA